ncbi:uncharacterized protein LOC116123189 [Pistacia vera]|uniref:uncharacterized protein LOC116123189 n=1 Tax=Pistacia vera TaxID=55513 RepID=UPI001263D33E|nr:uncharacterized protein LOC116123189 [Pistacia vera]
MASFKNFPWNGLEVRIMILLSLLLQIILIILGYQRKNTRRIRINLLVWLAYLLVDLVATVTLGTIARSLGDSEEDDDRLTSNNILTFWAPFLLLHLGGPDTITAYSLEDNELWLRHFLGLLVQIGVAFYIFIRSWENTTTAFTFITIPMLITGIIKYGERTLVLRYSSAKHLKDSLRSTPDAGPNYAEIIGNASTNEELLRADSSRVIDVPHDERIKPGDSCFIEAYFLFERFTYLFADLILGYHERKDSFSIISNKSAKEAFELVAIELVFMYDLLYTKLSIIYSRLGILRRCICLFSYVPVIVVFLIIIDKSAYPRIDILITYVLILGAIFLEVYALIGLLFSDCKRWSGSIGQYNLLSFCLKDISLATTYFIRALNFFGIKEVVEKYQYLTWKEVNDELKEVIFKQILEKGKQIEGDLFSIKLCKELLAERGDNVLKKWFCFDEFCWSTIEVEFDHSFLLWHIATDLCYLADFGDNEDDNDETLPIECKISRWLSNYMLYLLVICPTMLPKGIGEIRYRDTCAEAKRFFIEKKSGKSSSSKFTTYMEELLEVNTGESLERIKGDRSQSVLFFGCRLAKQLQMHWWSKKQKWEMISEVWVEMLGYVANHCGWKEHGQHLMKGGELLTHVCLLMAHLGLSEQYQIQKQLIRRSMQRKFDRRIDTFRKSRFHHRFRCF